MSDKLLSSVRQASEKWKTAFNAGNAAECAACYEAEALMVASPFGEFRGRKAIEEFWTQIIGDGYASVTYTDIKIDVIDDSSAVLSANWSMNKAKGIITKELWVLQESGIALLREDYFEALA